MYADSSFDKPRNSSALPTRQPALSIFLRLSDFTMVSFQPRLAVIDYGPGCPGGLLPKYLENDYGIVFQAIDDPPCKILIDDTQFVDTSTYCWHRPRMGKRQLVSPLQTAKKKPCFDARCPGKRGCFDLAVQPYQWLVIWTHGALYTIYDILKRTCTGSLHMRLIRQPPIVESTRLASLSPMPGCGRYSL